MALVLAVLPALALPHALPCQSLRGFLLALLVIAARPFPALDDLLDDVLRLARRVVDRGLDGGGSGFIVRQKPNPL